MRQTTMAFFKTFILLSSLCHLVGGFFVIRGIDTKNSRPFSSAVTYKPPDGHDGMEGSTKLSLSMTPLPSNGDVDEMKRDIEVLKKTTRNIEVLLSNTAKQDAINTKFDAKFASIDAKSDPLNESMASILHGSPADGPKGLFGFPLWIEILLSVLCIGNLIASFIALCLELEAYSNK
jgi:hypothetical protein